MLNQLQIKRYSYRLQVEFRTLSKICKKPYYKYAQSQLTYRRNANLSRFQTTRLLHYCLTSWGRQILSAQICLALWSSRPF